ncbi:MAG: hypothetical protein HOQ17_00700 [Gemmatimonadaceae bacterium]|nr:hypothetical protein [Gemmatimonadaceae bacterium]NUR36209.1 hypothetical protein [Gemmatimonadaceae bacterium]NUS31547.1 hypothetical protein [Gemmatimonadaceae bacterium]NUS46031.1 hypothetical protein [Gemmatimonadaceae bacterium]
MRETERDAVRDTDNLGSTGSGETSEGVWPYLGVGCMTAIVGFFGTGMIAILVAKLVGGMTGCAVEAETGAPCNWLTYAVRGGVLGMILLPTFIIWRMRKTRTAHRNSE